MKHLDIKIYGRVQGVNFRYFLKIKANEIGIKGWVRNMSDGSLQVEAEGKESVLRNFLKFCQEGPDYAVVESVEHNFGSIKNFKGFEIK